MAKVGVRELKQNASAVLRRVQAGEVLEVTERGRSVALLVPIPLATEVVERLVTEGRATPASGNLNDLPPPIKAPTGRPLPSEVLAELREDER
jgi:prevent-host-death family protein